MPETTNTGHAPRAAAKGKRSSGGGTGNAAHNALADPTTWDTATAARSTTGKLSDGSRVAVIGGGPAGSLFSYFLLKTPGMKNGLSPSTAAMDRATHRPQQFVP